MQALSRARLRIPRKRYSGRGFQDARVQDTQVLIVGAGPVGLTLALDLAAARRARDARRAQPDVDPAAEDGALQHPHDGDLPPPGHRRDRPQRRAAARVADGRLPRRLDGRARSDRAPAVSVGRRSESDDRGAQRRPPARALSTDLAVHARTAAALDRRDATRTDHPLQLRDDVVRRGSRPASPRRCKPIRASTRSAPRTSSAATAAPARCANSSASRWPVKAASANSARRSFTRPTSTNASRWAKAGITTSPPGRSFRSSSSRTAPSIGRCTRRPRTMPR